MAEDSRRRGASPLGPLLLAVIFLAVLGGGVGFSLGTLSKHQRNAAATQDDGTASNRRDDGTGNGQGSGSGNGSGTGGGNGGRHRCTPHTEELAGAGELTQVIYLHTAKSEVWICKSSSGTLFYQGHTGNPGEQLQENVNALFLTDVQQEGDNGYVATNTDPAGPITKYHVKPKRLVKEYVNYQTPKPSVTENSVD
jgi:hypothetical protein